ncbi:hypothetical protein LQW54_007151 [Pestalotiopsis sp. IQ-011]
MGSNSGFRSPSIGSITLLLLFFCSGVLSMGWPNVTHNLTICAKCPPPGHKSDETLPKTHETYPKTNSTQPETNETRPATNTTTSTAPAHPVWTISNLKRKCVMKNRICIWKFGIDSGEEGAATPCYFVVGHTWSGEDAGRKANSTGHVCGPYTVSSGYSEQFGPGHRFSILAVVDDSKQLIAWPAYSEEELDNGTTVKPDKRYMPAKLPEAVTPPSGDKESSS